MTSLPPRKPNVFIRLNERRDRLNQLLDVGFGPHQLREAGAPSWMIQDSATLLVQRRRSQRRRAAQ